MISGGDYNSGIGNLSFVHRGLGYKETQKEGKARPPAQANQQHEPAGSSTGLCTHGVNNISAIPQFTTSTVHDLQSKGYSEVIT